MKQTLTFLCGLCTCLALGQTNYQLNGTGNWDDPAVWTPNGIPGANDTATITGAYNSTQMSVTLTGNVNIARLAFTGYWDKHTIDGSGTITLGTTSEWRGGALAGDVTLHVPSGVTLDLSQDGNGSNLKRMTGNAALTNDGTLTWTGTSFWLLDNSRLTNNGAFNCTVSDAVSIYGNGNLGACSMPTCRFSNTGTFTFDGSGNSLAVEAWVDNSGIINVNSGYLDFRQNRTENSGQLNLNAANANTNRLFNYESNGGTLHFAAATTVEINSKCRRSVIGSVTGSTGTLKFAESALATDTNILNIAIPGGIVLDLSAPGLLRLDVVQEVNNSMTLEKEIVGTGTLVVKAPHRVTWTDGYFDGGADLTVDASAFLDLPSGDNRSISDGSVLTNYGTLTFSGGTFGLDNGILNNHGVLTIAGDLNITNGGTSFLNNYGTLEKTSGGNYGVVEPKVENLASGFISLTSGFLEFRAFNITNDGTINGNGIFQFPQPSNYGGTADQTIAGTVSPGTSGIGEISFWLPTNIHLTGTLEVQTQGSLCDKLKSDGNTLYLQPGSTLQVSEMSALPANSYCVVVQTEKNIVGTFGTENLPAGYSLQYNDKEVWLINGVLPVELVRFEGSSLPRGNSLHWLTASESDAAGFEVERSPDGLTWIHIGTVTAVGNSSVLQEYSFLDTQAPVECYYRLRLVDRDGSYMYSDLVFLRKGLPAPEGLSVFPNPVGAAGQVTVRPAHPSGKLMVRDFSGRIFLEHALDDGTPSPGPVHISLQSLPAGVYLLQHVNGRDVSSIRLVK